MGIAPNYSNSVEITGDGTLVINVKGENYDGISSGADVKISDKARVIINSEGGLGIAGRMVEIDGATVDSTGLYAGIDAHGLKIVNGAEVSCTSTANSAIWTKGDILIKGGAKVTTDGKYPWAVTVLYRRRSRD